jgi:hypothetical protein
MKGFLSDPLIEARLGFFTSLAAELERFLKKFQNERPMIPFLHEELERLLRTVMKRLVKLEILNVSFTKLTTIDVLNPKKLLSVREIYIGFDSRNAIKSALIKLKDSEIEKFRAERRTNMIREIRENGALKSGKNQGILLQKSAGHPDLR